MLKVLCRTLGSNLRRIYVNSRDKTYKLNLKDIYTPVFIATQFIIARAWKQPKCSLTDKWIKKVWYKYTMEY